MALRPAQLICMSFAVICPHCGAEQTNDDGSEMWEPQDMKDGQGKRRCNSCDAEMLIVAAKSARVEY